MSANPEQSVLLKRLQRAGVLHEVDGGGGAHGAEAFEQAEDEEDQEIRWGS